MIFGGVGTGLYSILLYVLLAVFLGGLMVGRTPEYIGKKIEAREIRLVALGILITPLAALLLDSVSHGVRAPVELRSIRRSRALVHRASSETFYAYLSQANNNGSAFAGYTGLTTSIVGNVAGAHGITFADLLGGFTMLFARYAPILFALAVAGALVRKRVSPAGLGTMRTDNPTFVVLLIGVIVLVGALTFFPALLLGPIHPGPDRTPLLGASEMALRKEFLTSAIAVVDLIMFLGIVYPLVVTGVSQVAFPGDANGQKVYVGGKFVGSKIIGQNFQTPVYKNGKPEMSDGELVTTPDPALLPVAALGDGTGV